MANLSSYTNNKETLDQTKVAGVQFIYWPDYIDRSMYAQNCDTMAIKKICGSGYISNDLTVRKAIASAFNLETFRRTVAGGAK